MKSYASIDRIIEETYVICEVELVETIESKKIDYSDRKTKMMEFSLQEVENPIDGISEGDIIIVEQDTQNITKIYCKDYNEKRRRIEYISQLI